MRVCDSGGGMNGGEFRCRAVMMSVMQNNYRARGNFRGQGKIIGVAGMCVWTKIYNIIAMTNFFSESGQQRLYAEQP